MILEEKVGVPEVTVSHVKRRVPSEDSARSCDPKIVRLARDVDRGLVRRDTSFPRKYLIAWGQAVAHTASPSIARHEISSGAS